ncbi:MAG: hypothetical protein HZA17_11135 [Nitrospirae bacterium]|nr:hypothetical protein [Nitrospirota bacterium]
MSKIIQIIIAVALIFFPSFAGAYDVAVLKSAEIKPYNEALEGFRKACSCNITEFVLHGDNILKEILDDNPDMVLAIGMDAFNHVKTIKDRPVIYTMVPTHPASAVQNVSGVSISLSPDRYLDALLDVFPNARRIGVVFDPNRSEAFVNDAVHACRSRGLEIIAKKAMRPSDVPSLIDGMKDRIDVFWLLPDPMVVSPESLQYILLVSFQHKMPVFTFSKKYVDMGAIAALNIVPYDLGMQAGEIARKLFLDKGTKAQIRAFPRKTALTINSKIARKMGIEIRDEVLKRSNDAN